MEIASAFVIILAAAGVTFAAWLIYSSLIIPKNPNSVNTQNTQTTTTITSAVADFTKKCNDAGGVCSTNCANAVAGSALGNFLDNLFSWLSSLFAKSNSSATVGSVVSVSSSEIGSYPDYCTQQLPKCCVAVSSTVTTTNTSFIYTSSEATQTALNVLDQDLNAAVNSSFQPDFQNDLLH